MDHFLDWPGAKAVFVWSCRRARSCDIFLSLDFNFNWLYSQPIPTAMKTVLSSQVVKIPENGKAESHL